MRRYLMLLCAVCLFIAGQSVFAQDDGLPLEQEFSSDLMTFQYPDGWVTEDLELVVMLASDEDSLEDGDNLGDGQARITLIVGDMAGFGVPRRATLDEAGEAIEEFTRDEIMPATCELGRSIPDIEENGTRTVALFYECSAVDNLIFMREIDDENYALMVATMGKGSLKPLYPTLLAVMHTIGLPDGDSGSGSLVDIFGGNNNNNRGTTYTSEEMNLVLELPDGWYVTDIELDGNSMPVLTPVEDLNFDDDLPDMPFAIIDRYSLSQLGTSQSGDPAVAVLEYLNENAENDDFSEVIAFEYDGRSAAMTDADYRQFDNRAIVLMIDDDNYIYINIIASPGTIDEVTEEMLPIIETAALLSESDVDEATTDNIEIDIELSETMLSEDRRYAFDYPGDWEVEEEEIPVLVGSIETRGDTRILFNFQRDPTADDVAEYLEYEPIEDDPFVTEGVEVFLVDGQEIGRLILSDESGIFNLHQYAIEVEEDVFLVFIVGIAPYDNPEFEATVFAMLASARRNR